MVKSVKTFHLPNIARNVIKYDTVDDTNYKELKNTRIFSKIELFRFCSL